MTVGSVHWVALPSANGHEQKGRRPALVLQTEDYSSKLPTVLVVPLTSTRKALRFSGTTLIKATSETGLRQDSVALVFQLRAIDRSRIKEQIGKVSDDVINAVLRELDRLTGRLK